MLIAFRYFSTEMPCPDFTEKMPELKNVLAQFAAEFLQDSEGNIWKFGVAFFERRKRSDQTSELFSTAATPPDSSDRTVSGLVISIYNWNLSEKLEASGSEDEIMTVDDNPGSSTIEKLRQHHYFEGCEDLTQIVSKLRSVDFAETGEFTMDDGLTLYIIERGLIKIRCEDEVIEVDHRFPAFSSQMLTQKYKKFSMEVQSGTALLILNDSEIRGFWLSAKHDQCRQYQCLLASSPLFSSLNGDTRQALSDLMFTKRYSPGDVVYKVNEKTLDIDATSTSGVYFIRSGVISVTIKKKNKNYSVLKKAEESFGQITASDDTLLEEAVAKTNAVCVFLSSGAFTQVMQHSFFKPKHTMCSKCKTLVKEIN